MKLKKPVLTNDKKESRRSALTKSLKKRYEEQEESDSFAEGNGNTKIRFDKETLVVSTGCTLLDLAICGGRIRGGGIPGGILVEYSGPSGSGKTALAVDTASSVQFKGGEADIMDPEARLDKEYARIYGLKLNKKNYSRPDTVSEVFDIIESWEPKDEKVINAKIIDSIAALSTDMELSESGDKRGQKKAKELHAGCRKTARKIAKNNKLIIFTNHEMDGDYGKTNPGGKALPYYASLRVRIQQDRLEEETKSVNGKKITKSIGIRSKFFIKKNSLDNGFRDGYLYIINGLGIDDVRGNLQWYKDNTKSTKYLAVDKEYVPMKLAIDYIEKNNLENELREMVIDLWEEIEEKFKPKRKEKVRF